MPADSVPNNSSLPGFNIATFLLYPYVANTERERGGEGGRGGKMRKEKEGEGKKERSGLSLTIPTFITTSNPNYLPKPPPTHPISLL